MTDPTQPTDPIPPGLTPEQEAARLAAKETRPPRTPPPAGGPEDPADRTVTPIAHPTVVLPPNPPAQSTLGAHSPTAGPAGDPSAPIPARKPGLREILIGVLGLLTLGSTFLTWQSDGLLKHSAWASGLWVAGVLGLIAALVHVGRYLPPADKAFGALLPLLLATATVWVPVAHLRGHVGTVGTWVCLGAGLVLVYLLLVAAMSDPALRSVDNPDDFFD